LLQHKDVAEKAASLAHQMILEGADILDVGGESSRPGSVLISAEEEVRRVIPAIEAIKAKVPHAQISVDTFKADVAEQALQAGASIVNDITALAGDSRMAALVAKTNTTVVLMHNRAMAEGRYDSANYDDVVTDVAQDLLASVARAEKSGIARDKIILDPGIGFGKTPQQNLALITHLKKIGALGFPLLMGVSRKSFIGKTLDLAIDERLEGTAACVTACVLNGADILRVHDVKFMTRVVNMAAALRDA